MPYTPPSQRSPAASANTSPNSSRRSSIQATQPLGLSVVSKSELPRSASYLTRHRRTPSSRSPLFPSTTESPRPVTPDEQKNEPSSRAVVQSPPPVTGDAKMPAGAVISPPDSALNSSDDEEAKVKVSRGRKLENLAELQEAIRVIEQRRSPSPDRMPEQGPAPAQGLALAVPAAREEEKPTVVHAQQPAPKTVRKLGHNRASTEGSVFLNLRGSNTPSSPSDEASDDEEFEGSERKPPMLRKKSGELVRPALRTPSARRRPSSMPGTPSFSKAVHFDSNLEHIRHFLQLDRPLAVSAGSSPVEAYDSDAEFPFDESPRSPPFEWEIILSNFPTESPIRLAQPVRVERVFLSGDNKTLVGTVSVANLAFHKTVVARFTLDYWKTTSEVVAEYNHNVREPKHSDGRDRFNFNIKLADLANLEAKTMFFCVKYCVNGQEYWDNNSSTNFQVDFRKKYKPQNGKKGYQGAASRPVTALPRSHRKSTSVTGQRPKPIQAAFDDFGDGFDEKYRLGNLKKPAHDYLGEPSTAVRLKGVKSDVGFDRRVPQSSAQAFGNRYDFGASLSAAINAANSVMGERSGLQMRGATTANSSKEAPDSDDSSSPLTMASPKSFGSPPSKGVDVPRPGGEKPVLASQSYNELLDKYCFFGSVKSSPQLKEGTLRSGHFDGTTETDYMSGSSESTAESSPVIMETRAPLTRTPSSQSVRSSSPAPLTGFVTGTPPMYSPVHMREFPFHESHTATAILG